MSEYKTTENPFEVEANANPITFDEIREAVPEI